MEISSLRTSRKLYVHEFGFRRKISLLFVLCIKKICGHFPAGFHHIITCFLIFLFTYYAKSAEITHIWRGKVNKAKRGVHSESIATVPPFGPIEGHKWFDQFSSQWESQKNRFAFIYFGKIQFLPACIWNLPFSCEHETQLNFDNLTPYIYPEEGMVLLEYWAMNSLLWRTRTSWRCFVYI
jgi:hypothetical protein